MAMRPALAWERPRGQEIHTDAVRLPTARGGNHLLELIQGAGDGLIAPIEQGLDDGGVALGIDDGGIDHEVDVDRADVRESRLERITLKRIGLEGARCPESLEYHEGPPAADQDEGVSIAAEHRHQLGEADSGGRRDVVLVVTSGSRPGHGRASTRASDGAARPPVPDPVPGSGPSPDRAEDYRRPGYP